MKTMFAPVRLNGARVKDEATLKEMTNKAGGKFFIEKGFAIRIKHIDPDSILFNSDVGAIDDASVVGWVDRRIKKNPRSTPTFTVDNFFVSGLWRPEDLSQIWPFTTPTEPKYRQLLVKKMIPASKLANLSSGGVDFSEMKTAKR
jgi:hypothetical protein